MAPGMGSWWRFLSRGVLHIMAYMGRLRAKGVPFLGFRYTQEQRFHSGDSFSASNSVGSSLTVQGFLIKTHSEEFACKWVSRIVQFMNYTTSKMYSCHLSDCGLTINSVYIRMFVFVCFHRRQIANSFEALRGSSECTLLKSANRFYAFYATFISCARAEHARVQFVPEGKTEPNL